MSSTDNTTRKINGLHLEDGMNEVLLTATPWIQQTGRRRPAATIPRLYHVRLLHHRSAQLMSATRWPKAPRAFGQALQVTGWQADTAPNTLRPLELQPSGATRSLALERFLFWGSGTLNCQKTDATGGLHATANKKSKASRDVNMQTDSVTNYKAWCLSGCPEGKLNA